MIIAKFIVFLLIMSLVYSGMHYYSYARIRNDFGIGRQRAVFLTVFYCIGGLSYFIGRMIQSKYGVGFVLAYGEIWMGVMSISVAVFVLRDLLSIFLKGKAKILTAIAVAVTLILSLAAFINAKHTAVRKINLVSSQIKGEVFRIAAFSDIHLEDNKSPVWLENLVAKVNSLEPDIIVIAGDFCDGALEAKKKLFIDALGKLSASDGVFAVTGNHEFYSGVKQFESFAEKAGIRMLRNESVLIAGKIILAGVDDEAGVGELDKALPPARPGGLPVVLLSHRPEIFDKAAERGVFLQFSGHTHAGQIPFFNLLVKLYYKHPYGLYRQGDSYIYTTSGAGTWGPPMRLGSKSEIVLFTIVNTVDKNR